jgi:hypothetical protein
MRRGFSKVRKRSAKRRNVESAPEIAGGGGHRRARARILSLHSILYTAIDPKGLSASALKTRDAPRVQFPCTPLVGEEKDLLTPVEKQAPSPEVEERQLPGSNIE